MKNRVITVAFAALMSFSCISYAFEDYNVPTHNLQVKSDFADYMANVQAKLQENWNPPDFIEECHIKLIFKLDNQGRLISGKILQSSGNIVYDEAAVDAVVKSLPFGNFPENTSRQTITINYEFDSDVIKSDKVKYYYNLARKYASAEQEQALKYINLAIAESNGNENYYFLYNRRAKIKEKLGDFAGAKEDEKTYISQKSVADLKRIHSLKYRAEKYNDPFSYYYLSYAYEQLKDYDNALLAIDKALSISELNATYKQHRENLLNKIQK